MGELEEAILECFILDLKGVELSFIKRQLIL